jgi:hypothetical protein
MSTLTAEDRSNLSSVLMEVFSAWNVGAAQQRALLGLEGERADLIWRVQKGEEMPDDDDLLARAEHLLAIHDCLRTAYPRSQNMAAHWLHQTSRQFPDRPPLTVMLEDGVQGLRAVRGHLDCTQGWF